VKHSLRDIANRNNIEAMVPPVDPIISFTRDEQMSMVTGLKTGAYSQIRHVLLTANPDSYKLERIRQIMQNAGDDVAAVLRRTPSD